MDKTVDSITMWCYNNQNEGREDKMHTKTELDNKNPIDLNEIIFNLWDNAATNQDTPYFNYVKIHDQLFMSEIKKFSMNIRKMDFSRFDVQTLEDTIENVSTDLYDSITKANLDYFKSGMKIGAKLLAELVI